MRLFFEIVGVFFLAVLLFGGNPKTGAISNAMQLPVSSSGTVVSDENGQVTCNGFTCSGDKDVRIETFNKSCPEHHERPAAHLQTKAVPLPIKNVIETSDQCIVFVENTAYKKQKVYIDQDVPGFIKNLFTDGKCEYLRKHERKRVHLPDGENTGRIVVSTKDKPGYCEYFDITPDSPKSQYCYILDGGKITTVKPETNKP